MYVIFNKFLLEELKQHISEIVSQVFKVYLSPFSHKAIQTNLEMYLAN